MHASDHVFRLGSLGRAALLTAAMLGSLQLSAQSAQFTEALAVAGGRVRGVLLERGGAAFKGIPYAQPPTGRLRWRASEPVARWSGVKDATAFGPPCAQSAQLQPATSKASVEDCLYLNVWTPEWPVRRRMPVMVWITGGGNYGGNASVAKYDGESLARHGVVVVSFNYRLALLGFLSHPALTRESLSRSSGNYGLIDQIAALRWVHDNITRFGGDPAHVTIFGESAGALDVNYLMVSPLTTGLFARAIVESGAVTSLGPATPLADAERQGETLVTRMVGNEADVETLRRLPVSEIFAAEPPYLSHAPSGLLAVVDGFVLPTQPSEVFADGRQRRVPLLIGSNARERVPGSVLPETLPDAIRSLYGSGPHFEKAKALYSQVARDPVYGTPAEQWATDVSFRCSTVLEADWHAAAGIRTYQYEFGRVPKGREAVGASHTGELPYVFGVLNPDALANAEFGGSDAELSMVMRTYWTNFAKTGDPNGPGLPNWPRYDRENRAYVDFSDRPTVKNDLRRQACALYAEALGFLRSR